MRHILWMAEIPAPVNRVTSESDVMLPNVPWNVFGIVFGVVLAAFLVWYVLNRRRGE